MFVELTNGNYANLSAVEYVYAFNNSGTWEIRTSPGTGTLVGTYASEVAAQDAIRKLVHGLDPSTVV